MIVFRIKNQGKYFAWLLAIQLLIRVPASVYLASSSPAPNEYMEVHGSIAANDEIITAAQDILPTHDSGQRFEKRGVTSQTATINLTKCQGKLQKRGQCFSSPRQNPAQNRRNRGNDRNRAQTIQQPSPLTHAQSPAGQTPASETMSQQTLTDRLRAQAPASPPSTARPPIGRPAHQSRPAAESRISSSSPQSARPPPQRARSTGHLERPKIQPGPASSVVQSAPSLLDLSLAKAHVRPFEAAKVAEQKAKSMRRNTIDLEKKARATVAAVVEPYPISMQGVKRTEERIRRHQEVVIEARAFARQLNRQATSYSKAAEASDLAANQARTDRNKKKAEWSRAMGDTWKSVSKTYSYSMQAQQQRLRDRAERRLIQSSPDPLRLALYGGNIQPLLRMHDLQSESRQSEFANKWEDASSIMEDNNRRVAQLRQTGGYESDEERPAQRNIPEPRIGGAPIRPYTPSPASSRGRPDVYEGNTRTSDSSSKPE